MKNIVPVFIGEVKEGVFTHSNPLYFESYLGELKDGSYGLSLKKLYKNRSDNQNRYYWGVIVRMISQELGYTSEETHEIIKAKFYMVPEFEIVTKGGLVFQVPSHPGSTRYATTTEAEEKYEEIRQWASIDLGIYIPLPNEGIAQND